MMEQDDASFTLDPSSSQSFTRVTSTGRSAEMGWKRNHAPSLVLLTGQVERAWSSPVGWRGWEMKSFAEERRWISRGVS